MQQNPLYGITNNALLVTPSVEAFFPGTNSIISAVDTLGKNFNNFTNELAKAFSEIKTQLRAGSAPKLQFDGKLNYNGSLPASLRVKGYLGVKEVGVQIPPGFKGNLKDYMGTLTTTMALLEDFQKNYFPSADKYLASLLNDDQKFFTQQTFTDELLASDINKAKAQIADYFTGSKASHLTQFGSVYRSLGEWEESIDLFISLMARMNAYSPDVVTKQINSLSEKADRIILKIKKSNEGVSKAVAKDIANVIYTMATAYEFYGAYTQFVNEAYISLINLTDTIVR